MDDSDPQYSILGRSLHVPLRTMTNSTFPDSSASSITLEALPHSSPEDLEAVLPRNGLDYELPAKRQPRLLRNVRHNLLSVYRRLFSLCITANIIAIIVVLYQSSTASLASASSLSTAISVNVLVAALARTEYVVNLLFLLTTWIPQDAPLRLRRIIAKVYEYGGVHSGAGASASLWVVVLTVQLTRAYFSEQSFETSILVLTYILSFLLIAITVSAYPSIRRLQHNSFEAVHRFGAWTSIALYWALIILITNNLHNQLSISFIHALITSPSFWILIVLTILLVRPWLSLRKAPVRAESLSSHAIRLHFDTLAIGLCQGLRISTSPLLEWHTFASIPAKESRSFSLLISNAGDWTRATIRAPAPAYYVKGIPVTGFFRVASLFRKIIIVTTGSGIGPALSGLTFARQTSKPLQYRLLWSTRDPETTYGKGVVEEVLEADPGAVILNTRPGERRLDLVAETWRLYVEEGAEAVFVISNPKVTHKIKYGMESRGVPAYGPVFDS